MLSLPNNQVFVLNNGKWKSMMFTSGSFESVKKEAIDCNKKYWNFPRGTKAKYNNKEFEL